MPNACIWRRGGLVRASAQAALSTGNRAHLVHGPLPAGVATGDVFLGNPAGVYTRGAKRRSMRFLKVKPPVKAELTRLTHMIAKRVGTYLERQGLIERDTGTIFLRPEAVDASDEAQRINRRLPQSVCQ